VDGRIYKPKKSCVLCYHQVSARDKRITKEYLKKNSKIIFNYFHMTCHKAKVYFIATHFVYIDVLT
jgi:hypothetical protein